MFSYTDVSDDGTKKYVVATTRLVGDEITRYNYLNVDISIQLEPDGDPDNGVEMHEVTAKIPEATDYKHIHFGVWAALGAAEEDGTQELSDLGIGFVQNFSGGG